MMWKEIVQDGKIAELFVYHNGNVIYKRWINYGYGVIIDLYGSPFSPFELERRRKYREQYPFVNQITREGNRIN